MWSDFTGYDLILPYFAFYSRATACSQRSGQKYVFATNFDHLPAMLLFGQYFDTYTSFDESKLSIILRIS